MGRGLATEIEAAGASTMGTASGIMVWFIGRPTCSVACNVSPRNCHAEPCNADRWAADEPHGGRPFDRFVDVVYGRRRADCCGGSGGGGPCVSDPVARWWRSIQGPAGSAEALVRALKEHHAPRRSTFGSTPTTTPDHIGGIGRVLAGEDGVLHTDDDIHVAEGLGPGGWITVRNDDGG